MTLLAVLRPLVARVARGAHLLLLIVPGALAAQTSLSHTEDAAPVPQGMLRFRVTNAWTRYDTRYGPGGELPLGADYSTDSLGTRQLPLLSPIQASLQTLTADPTVRLTLGRLVAQSDARIVTTPISLEYGLTRRLSIGVVVPVVQTRRSVLLLVNPYSPRLPNTGYLQPSERKAAAAANRGFADAFSTSASALAALIARCQQDPAGAGCAAVVGNPNDAAAVQAQALAFARAVQRLGTDSASVIVAPRAQGAVATRIEQQRIALNARLQQYLGSAATLAPAMATTTSELAYFDFNGRFGAPGLLQGPLGGGLDSIRTTERVGIGDVEIGAQYLLFDRFAHDSVSRPRIQSRLAIGGSIRFATSRPDSAQTLTDIATGDGAGFELRSAYDVVVGHLGGTAAARYVKHLARTRTVALAGDQEAVFPYPLFGPTEVTAGDVLAIDLTPRWLIGDAMAIDGHYGIERTGATTYAASTAPSPSCLGCFTAPAVTTATASRTAQRLGLGLRYSTVDAYARGQAPYPVEITYTHLETITGDVGLPKLSREQIQVRLYFRVR